MQKPGIPRPGGPGTVEIRELTRVYQPRRRREGGRPVVALDRVSLTVREGEVHGLLGPNGAGKTTLVKILATVLLPSAGQALVGALDVVRDRDLVRRRIGIVFGGERGLYTRLTARQNLRFWAALYQLPGRVAADRTNRLLDRVGLAERGDSRVETFSRGMKQRLHLARGLIGDPTVLFLDEPTTGMDPVAAHEFRALIGELRAEGRTILLTTHDMAEAESVCDRVTLIDRGRLLATETPRDLAGQLGSSGRVECEGADEGLLRRLADLDGVVSVTRRADGLTLIRTDTQAAAGAVLRTLVEAGVTTVRSARPNLEETYLHLIGDRKLEV